MGLFFPQTHAEFVEWIPETEREGILAAYEKRLFSDDSANRMDAGRCWLKYSEACSLLRHDPELDEEAARRWEIACVGAGLGAGSFDIAAGRSGAACVVLFKYL
jgi:hypothetical protein